MIDLGLLGNAMSLPAGSQTGPLGSGKASALLEQQPGAKSGWTGLVDLLGLRAGDAPGPSDGRSGMGAADHPVFRDSLEQLTGPLAKQPVNKAPDTPIRNGLVQLAAVTARPGGEPYPAAPIETKGQVVAAPVSTDVPVPAVPGALPVSVVPIRPAMKGSEQTTILPTSERKTVGAHPSLQSLKRPASTEPAFVSESSSTSSVVAAVQAADEGAVVPLPTLPVVNPVPQPVVTDQLMDTATIAPAGAIPAGTTSAALPSAANMLRADLPAPANTAVADFRPTLQTGEKKKVSTVPQTETSNALPLAPTPLTAAAPGPVGPTSAPVAALPSTVIHSPSFVPDPTPSSHALHVSPSGPNHIASAQEPFDTTPAATPLNNQSAASDTVATAQGDLRDQPAPLTSAAAVFQPMLAQPAAPPTDKKRLSAIIPSLDGNTSVAPPSAVREITAPTGPSALAPENLCPAIQVSSHTVTPAPIAVPEPAATLAVLPLHLSGGSSAGMGPAQPHTVDSPQIAAATPGGLSPGSVVPAEHTTIVATPNVLEVGVASGSHGWLKVRAELDGSGAVSASVMTTSSGAAETLHKELPALSAYLSGESVGLKSLVVNQAPALAQTEAQPLAGVAAQEGTMNLGGGAGAGGGGPARDPAYFVRSSSAPDDAIVSELTQSGDFSNPLLPNAAYGHGEGSWLSVRA